MGMKSNGIRKYPQTYTSILINNGIYIPIHPSLLSRSHYNAIDCGTDEELFLLIASIRDDNDKNQWFICMEDCLNLDIEPVEKGTWQYNDRYDKLPIRLRKIWKKATMKQVLKYYESKIKNQDIP